MKFFYHLLRQKKWNWLKSTKSNAMKNIKYVDVDVVVKWNKKSKILNTHGTECFAFFQINLLYYSIFFSSCPFILVLFDLLCPSGVHPSIKCSICSWYHYLQLNSMALYDITKINMNHIAPITMTATTISTMPIKKTTKNTKFKR